MNFWFYMNWSEIYKINIKRIKNENIFIKVSSVKSDNNNRMILMREKLYPKFKDKRMLLYFLPSFRYASKIFRNSNKNTMKI